MSVSLHFQFRRLRYTFSCISRGNFYMINKVKRCYSGPSFKTCHISHYSSSVASRAVEKSSVCKTKWHSKNVRKEFLDYFVHGKNHTFVKPSSVIPLHDETLLFVNSGMNQFKSIFLDQLPRGSTLSTIKSAANSQPCIRAGGKHNDLDDVGRDLYHHTFFEMLGNWSFGDYFKKEACKMAWELLTKIYGLPVQQLYVTYFGGDKNNYLEPDFESRDIWLQLGIAQDHIFPSGMETNFWEMGLCGPCGPCTEIHYDHCKEHSTAACRLSSGSPDMIEVWNIVFMQFNRLSNGHLDALQRKYVDTGMGLERLTALLQNTVSNYDTDIFNPIFEEIQRHGNIKPYQGLTGVADLNSTDYAYRLVADHARMLTFAISDGLKFNENSIGRQIFRRAVINSKQKLASIGGLLPKLSEVISNQLGEAYPELAKNLDRVKDSLQEEEEKFTIKLEKFSKQFDDIATKSSIIGGSDILRLINFHGDRELIETMASIHNIRVDWEGYDRILDKRKAIISANLKFLKTDAILTPLTASLKQSNITSTDDSCKYLYTYAKTSYDFEPLHTQAIRIMTADGKLVQEANKGDLVYIVFTQTNLYSEAGGQASDRGVFKTDHSTVHIEDSQHVGDYVIHKGEVGDGMLRVGVDGVLSVNGEWREGCMRNHTATHLLSSALRQILSTDCKQMGSTVKPTSLRFDFAFDSQIKDDTILQVEQLVNDIIKKQLIVERRVLPKDLALKEDNLIIMENEDYPSNVSVISIDSCYRELCCGTHVQNTGHIGQLLITQLRKRARGVYSVFAVTGQQAKTLKQLCEHFEQLEKQLNIKHETESEYKDIVDRYKTERNKLRKLQEESGPSSLPLTIQRTLAKDLKIEPWQPYNLQASMKYDKKQYMEQFKEEWDNIQMETKNRPHLCTLIKTEGNAKKILKYIRGTEPRRPTFIVIRNFDTNDLICAAWVPLDKFEVTAKDWTTSVTGLSVATFREPKNPEYNSWKVGSNDQTENILKSANKFADDHFSSLKKFL